MKLLPRRGSPRRKAWIRRYTIAAVVLLGAGIAYVAAPVVKRVYNEGKKDRAIEQAEGFIAEADFANAKLALEVALAAKPGDPEALRVAANMLDQVGLPEVMPLRRRLVQADPDSAENHAQMVMSALRFNDLNAARDAMRLMTPEQANEPVALRAALAYAEATRNLPIADVLYQRLREAEPDNENLHVLHAVLRLNNPTPSARAAAIAELESLRQKPRHALFILRRLLVDAMSRRETERANQIAAELTASPQAVLSDHLHRANLDLNVNKRPFESVFSRILPEVADTSADASELLRWMILVGQADQAQTWLNQQSADIRDHPEVVNVRGELAVAQGEWDRLAELLEAGAWGPVQRDTVRLAFSARLAADRDNANLQEQTWKEALVSAGNSLPDLTLLYRLANVWGWEEATETALWSVARSYPSRTWAHQTLFDVYRQRRDTENMRALIGSLRENDASSPRYQYDWALLSMLLNQRASWTDEKRTMQTLFETDPGNPYYITGYAFALALAEREEEAVALLANLTPADHAHPERAPYLAFVYSRTYQTEQINTLVDGATAYAANYLPEESALLQKARDYVR
ncbi:MAG: hypothetical protein SynsKO_33030 [Synoicihabitans sp.]